MDAQNDTLYDTYTVELLKISGRGDAHYHIYKIDMISGPDNLLLLDGAEWRDSQGRAIEGIQKTMQKNLDTLSREVAYSIVAKMKLLNLPVDQTRWQIYESMVLEVAETFLKNRIFPNREAYEKTVCDSDALRAAQDFLMKPLVSPPKLNTAKYSLDFEE